MGALEVDVSDYKAFYERLKAADRSVQSSVRRRLAQVGKPLAEAIVRDGPEGLPEGGGLTQWLRAAKGSVSVTKTRLTIQVSKGRKSDLGALNRGMLRHPVYGNRRRWALQGVAAGTYDKAFENEVEAHALDDMRDVLDDIMEEI